MKVVAPAKRQHGLARSQMTVLHAEIHAKYKDPWLSVVFLGSHRKAMVATMKSGTRATLFHIHAHTVAEWLIMGNPFS